MERRGRFPFQILGGEIDLKNNTYRIASAGSDGRFSGFGQKGEYSDLAGMDIIFADGAPVFTPQIDD
jgi:hypothetical protein